MPTPRLFRKIEMGEPPDSSASSFQNNSSVSYDGWSETGSSYSDADSPRQQFSKKLTPKRERLAPFPSLQRNDLPSFDFPLTVEPEQIESLNTPSRAQSSSGGSPSVVSGRRQKISAETNATPKAQSAATNFGPESAEAQAPRTPSSFHQLSVTSLFSPKREHRQKSFQAIDEDRSSISSRSSRAPPKSPDMSISPRNRSLRRTRAFSLPVSIRESPKQEDGERVSENYHHNTVTDQVVQIFRKLEHPSSYLPEYLKRKIPVAKRSILPRIYAIEEKLDGWPWLIDFCDHWGVSPLFLVSMVLAAFAFRKTYQRNAKRISRFVGFYYPLYKTARALITPRHPTSVSSPRRYGNGKVFSLNPSDPFEKWKSYWMIYSGVLLTDKCSETILHIYPFYFTSRSLFCYWLYHSNGAQYLLYNYIFPLWQSGVDAVSKAENIVSTVGQTSFGVDYIKETSALSSETARFRLIRVLQKLRDEMRFAESCRNILKSLSVNRDQMLIVSKDERALREDMEKCERKSRILIEAERRYRTMINWFVDDELPDPPINNTKINAQLFIKLRKISCRASPISSSKQKNDVFAVITVNDFPKAKTTRILSQIWDETFEIPVDRLSNRIEIQIYQLSLLGKHEIIAFCWFTVGELREELLDKYFSVFPIDVSEINLSLEPYGHIIAKVNLVEPIRTRQSIQDNELSHDLQDDDIYLTEDIRKVYTRNGHQFQIFKAVASLASDVMGARCSVCEESMIGGMRCYCQRCAFACHTKCFKGVLTKCISHTDIQTAPIGTDLNTGQLIEYNVPHQFEQRSLNLLRSWCTHCGLKVLVGERLVQCLGCGKCAHEKCQKLVPNFCGLSLADAAATAIKEEFRDKQKLLGL